MIISQFHIGKPVPLVYKLIEFNGLIQHVQMLFQCPNHLQRLHVPLGLFPPGYRNIFACISPYTWYGFVWCLTYNFTTLVTTSIQWSRLQSVEYDINIQLFYVDPTETAFVGKHPHSIRFWLTLFHLHFCMKRNQEFCWPFTICNSS